MTEMSINLIKNKTNEIDNPDFLWILRDFDFEVPENDSNLYFDSQIKNYEQRKLNYFKRNECTFLPYRNNMDEVYINAVNKLRTLIFDSLLRKKFMNGTEFADFVMLISKQLNETNLINYADLMITFHNTAKENLKAIKSKFINQLKILEEQMPFMWTEFRRMVLNVRNECLNELKSSIKQDEDFQKEYISEYSLFTEDKIHIFEGLNRDLLEKRHLGLLKHLMDPILTKINSNFYQNNEEELETDLKCVEDICKEKDNSCPEMGKVLNEQIVYCSEMFKNVVLNKTKFMQEKNGKLFISEALHSFCKELMNHFKDFPLPESEFESLIESAKIAEAQKLKAQITNRDVYLKLEKKLLDLLNKEANDIEKFNSIQMKSQRNALFFDFFLSYKRCGMREEIKLFRERLEKEGFKVWQDDLCLPNEMGEDYKKELIKGINNSRIFLFIWNRNYSESDSCMKEFKWAVSKKKKIVCIELEKNSNENDPILFDLMDKFIFKVYHIKKDCKLSEIPEYNFRNLVESIKNQLDDL